LETTELEEHEIIDEDKNIDEDDIIDEHKMSDGDMSFLKKLSIADLDEINPLKPDYKKMSINKLREVVVGKGIVVDASKFKKNDILKLLSDE
jgi:hypothetical protein